MAGKSCWQNLESAGHIAPTAMEQSDRYCFLAAILHFRHHRTQTPAVVLPSFSVGLSSSSHLIDTIHHRHAWELNNPTQDADEQLGPGDSRFCQVGNEHEASHCGGKTKLCRERAEDRRTGVLIWAENWTGVITKDSFLRLTRTGQSQRFYNSWLCLARQQKKRRVDAKDILISNGTRIHFESNVSDCGLETKAQLALNEMICCESCYMALYSQEIDNHNSIHLVIHWWRHQGSRLCQNWEISALCFRCYLMPFLPFKLAGMSGVVR